MTSSWDEPKWLKGTRKAIERTPHRLVGSKSAEDPEITVWTRNMSEASTGLNSIGVAADQLASRWVSSVKHLRNTIEAFLPLYLPIDDPDSAFKGVETPARSIERIKAVQDVLSHLESDTNVFAHEMSAKVKNAVDQSRQEVKNISSILTKRHHKKIDYDRVVASLSHQATKQGSPFDAENTDTEEQKLYETYDKRVREIVPSFLKEVDVVLKNMVLLVNHYLARFYGSLNTHLDNAAKAAGISEGTLQNAISEWQTEFSSIKPAVEALSFCKGGRNEIPSTFEGRGPNTSGLSDTFMGRAFNKVAQNVVMPRFVGGMGLFGDEHALSREASEAAPSDSDAKSPTPGGSAEPPEGEVVVALYPYKGDEGDLSFAAGDKIILVDRGAEGDPNWWLGKKQSDGKQGLFPKNYVKLADAAKERPLPTPPEVETSTTEKAPTVATTVPEPLPKTSAPISEPSTDPAPAVPPKEHLPATASQLAKEAVAPEPAPGAVPELPPKTTAAAAAPAPAVTEPATAKPVAEPAAAAAPAVTEPATAKPVAEPATETMTKPLSEPPTATVKETSIPAPAPGSVPEPEEISTIPVDDADLLEKPSASAASKDPVEVSKEIEVEDPSPAEGLTTADVKKPGDADELL